MSGNGIDLRQAALLATQQEQRIAALRMQSHFAAAAAIYGPMVAEYLRSLQLDGEGKISIDVEELRKLGSLAKLSALGLLEQFGLHKFDGASDNA